MSQTHNLLNRSFQSGASLRDILEQEMALYFSEDRTELAADNVRLEPVASVTLGVAFHELATNTAKYGAISVPHGQGRSLGCRVSLAEWAEAAPPILLPRRSGFGSQLLEQYCPARYAVMYGWTFSRKEFAVR